MARRRNCQDCGKPLGGTLGRCYECGGEKPQQSREERLQDAKWWKLQIGIDPREIEKAHSDE